MIKLAGAQTRGVRSRLGGYQYQCNVAALRMLDVLQRRASAIILERRFGDSDNFDDIKVVVEREKVLHAYQVRWGMHAPADLTWELFCDDGEPGSDLDLRRLRQAYQLLVQENDGMRVILHVYTTRRLQPDDRLARMLVPAPCSDGELRRFCDGTPSDVLVFDATQVAALIPEIGSVEWADVLRDIVIEIGQPQCPASREIEARGGHPMRDRVMARVQQLGLSKPPHSLDPRLVYERLVQYSLEQIVAHDLITPRMIEERLHVAIERAAVPQDFPFDEGQAVPSPLAAVFDSYLSIPAPAHVVAVVGPPGSGKSWALTALARTWGAAGAPIHYCFERPQGDRYLQQRARATTAVANIIKAVRLQYPGLSCFDEAYYADTVDRLDDVLARLAAEVQSPTAIPVIIDGLDHVARTLDAHREDTLEESVLEVVKTIRIPDGVVLIIGTQPTAALDDVATARGEDLVVVEMPEFTAPGCRTLLDRAGALDGLDSAITEPVVDAVVERSRGLPLYVRYMAEMLLTAKPDGERMLELIATLPELALGRDIGDYYAYLWHGSDNLAHMLMLRMAVLDFYVTREEVADNIFPGSERSWMPLDSAWAALRPLLRAGDDGIALFHDSFRRFLLDRLGEGGQEVQRNIAGRIADFLADGDAYASARTFLHLWPYLRLAGRQAAIRDEATLPWIDGAIAAGRSRSDIANNLEVALDATADLVDAPALCRVAFLLSYLERRFDNLPPAHMVRAAGALGRDTVVQRYIDNQAFAGLEDNDFLALLGHAAVERWAIDGNALLRRWWRDVNADKTRRDDVDWYAFVRALTLWAGGQAALEWVRNSIRADQREPFVGDVYLTLAEVGRVADIEANRDAVGDAAHRELLECLVAATYHNASAWHGPVTLSGAARGVAREWGLARIAGVLADAQVPLTLLEELVSFEQVPFTPPQHVLSTDDLSPYETLLTGMRVAARRDGRHALDRAAVWMGALPDSYLKAFCQLAIAAGVAMGLRDHGSHLPLNEVLESFQRLISWRDSASSTPRRWHLSGLTRPATNLCDHVSRFVLQEGTGGERETFYAHMRHYLLGQVRDDWDGDDAYRDLVFGAMEHALTLAPEDDHDALRALCLLLEEDVKQHAGYETERATGFLRVARLWAALGHADEAARAYETAMRASFAHGWRKDTVLFYLGELADALNRADPEGWTERLRSLGELTQWVGTITDGDETSALPGTLCALVAKHSLPAAAAMVRDFQERLDRRSYSSGVRLFAEDSRLAPSFRVALLTTLFDELDGTAIAKLAIHAWRDEVVARGPQVAWLDGHVRVILQCALGDGDSRNQLMAAYDALTAQPVDILAGADLDEVLRTSTDSADGGVSPIPDDAVDPEEVRGRLRETETAQLLGVDIPYHLEHILQEECAERARVMQDDELVAWALQVDRSRSMRAKLLTLAADRCRITDPGKAIDLLLEHFSAGHGWNRYFSLVSRDALFAAIDIDADSAIVALGHRLAADMREARYYGHGGFETFGTALIRAGRVDIAQRVFDEILALCHAMLRTFPPKLPAYGWLVNDAPVNPPLPSDPEHEVLIRRLLVPELDIHRLAIAAIRSTLAVMPSLARSLCETIAQLTTVHGRTAALVALRAVGITDQQRLMLADALSDEDRLPVLLEAKALNLMIRFPPARPILAITVPHQLESRVAGAVMPLAQEELDAVVREIGEDPATVRRQLVYRLTDRWDADRAYAVRSPYTHPNFQQIPFESMESRLLMDELYRWAASEYSTQPEAHRRRLAALVTHDDTESQEPAFACLPPSVDGLSVNLDTLTDVRTEDGQWVLLALQRYEQWEDGDRSTDMVAGSLAYGSPNWSPFEAAQIAKPPRATLDQFRHLKDGDLYDAQTGPGAIALLNQHSLVTGGQILFTLTARLRRTLGLSWISGGLDLQRDDHVVVRYRRWWMGFVAKNLERRWRDRGTALEVRADIVPDIESAMGVSLTIFAQKTERRVSQHRREEQLSDTKRTHFRLVP